MSHILSSSVSSPLITVKLTNKLRLFRTFETLSERAYDVSAKPTYEREVSEDRRRRKIKC